MHNNAGDSLLPCSVPFKLRHSFMSANKLVYDTNIVDPFTYGGEDVHTNSVQCFMTKSSPVSTLLDWNAAYDNDLSTKLIVSVLKDRHEPNKIPENKFSSVNPAGYKTNLQAGRIQMLNEKLVLYQPVLMDTKIVSLITIVPESLRKKIFCHFHAGPHMGEYKTLYRMHLRFFWPKMLSDIKEWSASCDHCQAYNIWRSRKSELYFSWPVTVPFWIMHVDLWSPGDTTSSINEKGYLMNSMCDLTQFVISSVTFDTTALELSQLLFMSDVILTFGMCAPVIIVDEGSNFKVAFQEMCDILKITCWLLARGNHKGLSVETYHRFLN